jgi:adenylate kinase
MRIGLSGTPGTGKTSVATKLRKNGYTVVGLNELAIEQGFIDGVDRKRNSKLIDMNKLDRYIKKNYTGNDLVFFEGHVAHLLSSIQNVIILRCHPRKLQKRLSKKKWTTEKIQENVEAEALDIILCDAVVHHTKNHIFEIDTTSKTTDEITSIIITLVNHKFKPTKPYSIGQIDWSEEILKKYLT